jgi:glycosyltransferase involved in cell wall biosynthesis
MRVPILLGVNGEAKKLFVEKGNCAVYFEPGNSVALAQAIGVLLDNPDQAAKMGENGRRFVNECFNRETIASNFHKELLILQNVTKT